MEKLSAPNFAGFKELEMFELETRLRIKSGFSMKRAYPVCPFVNVSPSIR